MSGRQAWWLGFLGTFAVVLGVLLILAAIASAQPRRPWEPQRTRFAIGECAEWRASPFPWSRKLTIKIIDIGQDFYLVRNWLGEYGWAGAKDDSPLMISAVDGYMAKVECP